MDLLAKTEAWVRQRFSLEGFTIMETTIKADSISVKLSNRECKIAITVDREVVDPKPIEDDATDGASIDSQNLQ